MANQYPRGIAFPFRFSNSGGVETAEGDAKIEDNLTALVLSPINSRFIRKAVGTIGFSMLLRSGEQYSDEIIRSLVEEAIQRFEPRAVVLAISISREDNESGHTKFLDIKWRRQSSSEINSSSIKLV